MDEKNKIKSILQRGKIYASQGLLKEAITEYKKAKTMIGHHDNIPNQTKWVEMISAKILSLQQDEETLLKTGQTSEVASDVQDLMKKLFTCPKSRKAKLKELESAVVLARFGQYNSALKEFSRLLKDNALRVSAAKNMIRCHVSQSGFREAVTQFQQWRNSHLFSEKQLQKVQTFLEEILERKGMSLKILLSSKSVTMDLDLSVEENEELIDISAVGIKLAGGYFQDKEIEFDVNFQSGDIISILISRQEQKLIDYFYVGLHLQDVTFYSPVAIFKGSGVVKMKTQINSGPNQGDYTMDIKIESI
jgi:tetratricopeptide (TPR) repeat protein